MELPVTYIVQFKSIYIVTQLFPILCYNCTKHATFTPKRYTLHKL